MIPLRKMPSSSIGLLLLVIITGCGRDARQVQEGMGGTGGGPAEAPSGEAGMLGSAGAPKGGEERGGAPADGGDGAAGSDGSGDGGHAGAGGGDDCLSECGDGLICEQGRCVECTQGSSARCNENAPVVCEDGAWTELAVCGGDTPACSYGACGAAVLAGALVTVSAPLLTNSEIQLVEHGMEYLPPGCTQDDSICLTGGIYP